MAAYRDLPLPLVIVCLVVIRGYTPLPTTSEVTGTDPMKPLIAHGFTTVPLQNYDDYEDTTPILPERVSKKGETIKRCDYYPCLENQISCSKLAASTGCRCPGFTLNNESPEAPNLEKVSWNGSEVVVKWCAPKSYVTAYIVTVEGQGMREFRKDQRSGTVGEIDHIAKVCVMARNDAGESEASCMLYHPRDNSLPLKAGLIGGALGFLLLLLLAVLLWRHKRQMKQEACISMHNTSGIQ